MYDISVIEVSTYTDTIINNKVMHTLNEHSWETKIIKQDSENCK